jgi:hypothetical protein
VFVSLFLVFVDCGGEEVKGVEEQLQLRLRARAVSPPHIASKIKI